MTRRRELVRIQSGGFPFERLHIKLNQAPGRVHKRRRHVNDKGPRMPDMTMCFAKER